MSQGSDDMLKMSKVFAVMKHADNLRLGIEVAVCGALVTLLLTQEMGGLPTALTLVAIVFVAFAAAASYIRLNLNVAYEAMAHFGEKPPKTIDEKLGLTTESMWSGLVRGEMICFALGLLASIAAIMFVATCRTDSWFPVPVVLLTSGVASVILGWSMAAKRR